MRRRRVHTAFAIASLACAALVASQAARLSQARRVNEAIDASSRAGDAADVAVIGASGPDGGALPQARFAQALAMSRAGRHDAATAAYKALAQSKPDGLRRAALYNLGNEYMREAMKNGAARALDSLPLIELAKESYREVLRGEPEDWDARYNLERALRLAPEMDEQAPEETAPSVDKERTTTTAPLMRIDLP